MLNEEYYKIIDSLAMINEDTEKPVKTPEEIDKEIKSEKESNSDETDTPKKSLREEVRKLMEPQVDVANSLITSIHDSFADNCNQSKKISNMEDQIKNWEKQVRGACEQIVFNVQNKHLEIDKSICSPRAFKKISNSDSRDLSVLDLCAAIIVFYNSLG